MSEKREVVIVGATRTAIGSFGGSLKDVPLGEMAAATIKEAVQRAGVAPSDVGHTVVGNVIHTEPRDMYIARYASVTAGLPYETPALTLNRLCGSGLQAVCTAASYIELGHATCTVGACAESMSRTPYWLPGMRWGQRMNDGAVVDAMVGALTDPFDKCHMGITAENIAEKWDIAREDQDAAAAESHRRAVAAIDNGYFKDQILPIERKTRKGTVVFDTDENPRREVDVETMGGMRPVFKKDGSVTAGNASSLNDAAAAVVLMDRATAEERGIKPLARLVGYTVAGVDPKYMGIGPVPAIKQLLEKTGVSKDDVDLWELNEAFAVQALAVCRDLGLDMDKVNPNGSGISLGHPIGATGALLTVKAVYELQRTGGRYAGISMCIGGGQGIAALIERL